ncbi:MAG TPA: hypothetical protein VNC78_05735 [Actinomycetota bacterium]|nr:hypothetical protein [Actinomycetota bacterium]
MTRNQRCLTIALVLTLLGLPGQGTAQRGTPKAVGKATLKEFTIRFERILDKTLDGLLPKLERLGGGKIEQRIIGTKLVVGGGTVRAQGLGLMLPQPPKYELTLKFTEVGDVKDVRKRMSISGTLQYNVIDHPGASSGLLRGIVTLKGSFRGRVEIVAEVSDGEIVALVADSGDKSYRLGARDPRPVVTWTSTLAGTGDEGFVDGNGTAASFFEPAGVTSDDGFVYVADKRNEAVRKITPQGQVTTLARNLGEVSDVDTDTAGNVIAAIDFGAPEPLLRIDPVSGAVEPIIFNDGICPPSMLDTCDGRSPIGTMQWPQGIEAQGDLIYVSQAHYPPSLRMVLPDGYVMTIYEPAAENDREAPKVCSGPLNIPPSFNDMAKGINGEFYFVFPSTGCYAIYALQPDGTARRIAGNPQESGTADGGRDEARFFNPSGLAFDGSRYLYVADGHNLIRRVDVNTGDTVRVVGCLSHTEGFDCTNDFGFRDGDADFAQLDKPEHISLDQNGDLYIPDKGNNAIRFTRMVSDPVRTPFVDAFRPFGVEQGAKTTLEVRGRNLSLASGADLGPGIDVVLRNAGTRRLFLDISVAPDATPGPRALTIETPYGNTTTPPDLSLEILEPGFSGAVVTTIAGTGSWTPGSHDGPAEKTEIGFPAGIEMRDEERILFVDTLEQKVRLIASREGAIREVIELLLYAKDFRGELNPILNALGKLGLILRGFGIEAQMDTATETTLRPVAAEAVDEWCRQENGDCRRFAMPWMGASTPGATDDMRLDAKLFLPSDIAKVSDTTFMVADAGNFRVRIIGRDPKGAVAPEAAKIRTFSTDRYRSSPFSVGGLDADTGLVGFADQAMLQRVPLAPGGPKTNLMGLENDRRCVKAPEDALHPAGTPFGIASEGDVTLMADPFCQTIFRIDDATGEVEDVRGETRGGGLDVGPCSDGPIGFATFGAAVDIDVDGEGNIWVADTVCNSIRVIKNLGSPDDSLAGQLRDYLGSVAGHLPQAAATMIKQKLDSLDQEFLATNRWWVITVAGSPDGDSGYVDAPAQEALFHAPNAITTVDRDGTTFVYVSDALNRVIRRIEVP